MNTRTILCALSVLAVWSAPWAAGIDPVASADGVSLDSLWKPIDRTGFVDAFNGPWGAHAAPAPHVEYRYLKPKTSGVNPGMTVIDPAGRKWSVKQAPHDDRGDEGPIEVVVSRILSLAGYHQPPVYYLPSFTLVDTFGRRTEPGGRFRLSHPAFKERQTWSWEENPFVGTRPHQGLLVILMMLNASDLRNTNNSVFEFRHDSGEREFRYVVRDLGTALGATGRYQRRRGDLELFERLPFATGLRDGYLVFDNYAGWGQDLFRGRITPADVEWACERLDDIQLVEWRDAFRAGQYSGATAARYIARIRQKVGEARALIGTAAARPWR